MVEPRGSLLSVEGTRRARAWGAAALTVIDEEASRDAVTPLVPLSLESLAGIDIYLKDESAHPTGSLKHRLARSLFVHAICSGEIGPETTIIEASSGSTAVSEAYFAQLIGLPFIAVVPTTTSPEKIALIEQYGGQCHTVEDPNEVVVTAERLAADSNGFFMDQFSHAAEATQWRSANIAEEIFAQMAAEPHPVPEWIVVGAGTGGTSTTIGRYTRFHQHPSAVAVVDPEGSAFYEGWRRRDRAVTTDRPSRIEGIGRTRVERSFSPGAIDLVIPVMDAASVAAMRWCSEQLGRRVGASTGTNIWGTLQLGVDLRTRGHSGSLVSLICDAGDRYGSTYYDDAWLAANGIDIASHAEALRRFETTGELIAPDSAT